MIFHRRVKRKNVTARVTSSFINLCVKTTFKGYSKLLGEQTSRKHQSYRSSPLASKETRLFRSLSPSLIKKMRDYSQSSNKQVIPMFWESIYLPDVLIRPSTHLSAHPFIYASIRPSNHLSSTLRSRRQLFFGQFLQSACVLEISPFALIRAFVRSVLSSRHLMRQIL